MKILFLLALLLSPRQHTLVHACAGTGQKTTWCNAKGGNVVNDECCAGLVCGGGGKCVNGGGGGDDGGGNDDCPEKLVVSCIRWETTSGRKKHLHGIVGVTNPANGNGVGGVDVSMTLSRNGSVYRTTTVTTYESSSSSLNSYPNLSQCPLNTVVGNTAYGITPAQCTNNAKSGLYTLEVTGVSKTSCPNPPQWDETDPNSITMETVDFPFRRRGLRA